VTQSSRGKEIRFKFARLSISIQGSQGFGRIWPPVGSIWSW